MNSLNAYSTNRHDQNKSGGSSYFSHLWIWLSAAAAGVLLMWFVSVLNDITERGEQRRMHQRTSGMLLLPDEIRARGATAGANVISANVENVALR